MALPGYSIAARCPKCACQAIDDRFHADATPGQPCAQKVPPHVEHVDRTCSRCSFSWHELPMDGTKVGRKLLKTLAKADKRRLEKKPKVQKKAAVSKPKKKEVES